MQRDSMQASLFDAFPEADFHAAIVWIKIMDHEGAGTVTARRATSSPSSVRGTPIWGAVSLVETLRRGPLAVKLNVNGRVGRPSPPRSMPILND